MHPPTTSTYLPTTLLLLLTPILASTPRQASLLTCNQDNQLRALERFGTQASTFCPTYLSPSPTTTTAAALPTYVSDFQSADVSSACACFQASATESAVVVTLEGIAVPTTTAPTASVTPEQTAVPSVGGHGGLSVGAKAGIGIACVVGVVGCIVGVVMFFRRKRGDGGKGAGVSRGDEGVGGVGPPACDAVEKDAGGYNFEVEGGDRFELQGGKGGGG